MPVTASPCVWCGARTHQTIYSWHRKLQALIWNVHAGRRSEWPNRSGRPAYPHMQTKRELAAPAGCSWYREVAELLVDLGVIEE